MSFLFAHQLQNIGFRTGKGALFFELIGGFSRENTLRKFAPCAPMFRLSPAEACGQNKTPPPRREGAFRVLTNPGGVWGGPQASPFSIIFDGMYVKNAFSQSKRLRLRRKMISFGQEIRASGANFRSSLLR